MEQEYTGNTIPIHPSEDKRLTVCKIHQSHRQCQEQGKYDNSSKESLFLTNGTEDKIGILFWNKMQFCLRSIKESLTRQSS